MTCFVVLTKQCTDKSHWIGPRRTLSACRKTAKDTIFNYSGLDRECVKNADGIAGSWLTAMFACSDEDNASDLFNFGKAAVCKSSDKIPIILMFHLNIHFYCFAAWADTLWFDQSLLYWWDVTTATKAVAANPSPADTVCSHTDWWLTWFYFVRIKNGASASSQGSKRTAMQFALIFEERL